MKFEIPNIFRRRLENRDQGFFFVSLLTLVNKQMLAQNVFLFNDHLLKFPVGRCRPTVSSCHPPSAGLPSPLAKFK